MPAAGDGPRGALAGAPAPPAGRAAVAGAPPPLQAAPADVGHRVRAPHGLAFTAAPPPTSQRGAPPGFAPLRPAAMPALSAPWAAGLGIMLRPMLVRVAVPMMWAPVPNLGGVLARVPVPGAPTTVLPALPWPAARPTGRTLAPPVAAPVATAGHTAVAAAEYASARAPRDAAAPRSPDFDVARAADVAAQRVLADAELAAVVNAVELAAFSRRDQALAEKLAREEGHLHRLDVRGAEAETPRAAVAEHPQGGGLPRPVDLPDDVVERHWAGRQQQQRLVMWWFSWGVALFFYFGYDADHILDVCSCMYAVNAAAAPDGAQAQARCRRPQPDVARQQRPGCEPACGPRRRQRAWQRHGAASFDAG
jgi:hypothetical protein